MVSGIFSGVLRTTLSSGTAARTVGPTLEPRQRGAVGAVCLFISSVTH